jgi:hypothetical protein
VERGHHRGAVYSVCADDEQPRADLWCHLSIIRFLEQQRRKDPGASDEPIIYIHLERSLVSFTPTGVWLSSLSLDDRAYSTAGNPGESQGDFRSEGGAGGDPKESRGRAESDQGWS